MRLLSSSGRKNWLRNGYIFGNNTFALVFMAELELKLLLETILENPTYVVEHYLFVDLETDDHRFAD